MQLPFARLVFRAFNLSGSQLWSTEEAVSIPGNDLFHDYFAAAVPEIDWQGLDLDVPVDVHFFG